MESFSDRVYDLVARIPYGQVSTYGDLAAILGSPRAARGVGHALRSLPPDTRIPWWRVVNARGEIALRSFGGRMQRALLEQEGVRFSSGRVDLRAYGWNRVNRREGRDS